MRLEGSYPRQVPEWEPKGGCVREWHGKQFGVEGKEKMQLMLRREMRPSANSSVSGEQIQVMLHVRLTSSSCWGLVLTVTSHNLEGFVMWSHCLFQTFIPFLWQLLFNSASLFTHSMWPSKVGTEF